MLFRVDPGASLFLAEQIAVQVRGAIADGTLAPSERLPPARELATSLHVNMHTVLRAYGQLRDEGLIDMRPSRGAHVKEDAGSAIVRVNELTAQLVTEARKIGLSTSDVHSRIDRLMGGVA